MLFIRVRMEKLAKEIQSKCKKITKKFPPARKNGAGFACQQFTESLLSLERRYNELLKIEREILDFSENSKPGRSLNEIQLDYVDKTHAFHQQIYATISALMKLLTLLGNEEFIQQFLQGKNLRSVERFLKNLRDTGPHAEHIDCSIGFLLHSRYYRAKFVDHPQQLKIHSWITQSLAEHVAIIYFGFPKDKVFAPNPMINPYFILDEDIFVPRHHTWVYNSLINLVGHSLNILNKKVTRNSSDAQKKCKSDIYKLVK